MIYFPGDIICHICDFLDIKILMNKLCMVDRRWNKYCRQIDFKERKMEISNFLVNKDLNVSLKYTLGFFKPRSGVYLHIPEVSLKYIPGIVKSGLNLSSNFRRYLEEILKYQIYSKYNVYPREIYYGMLISRLYNILNKNPKILFTEKFQRN